MVDPRLKAGFRLLAEGLSFAWQAPPDARGIDACGRSLRATRSAQIGPDARRPIRACLAIYFYLEASADVFLTHPPFATDFRYCATPPVGPSSRPFLPLTSSQSHAECRCFLARGWIASLQLPRDRGRAYFLARECP